MLGALFVGTPLIKKQIKKHNPFIIPLLKRKHGDWRTRYTAKDLGKTMSDVFDREIPKQMSKNNPLYDYMCNSSETNICYGSNNSSDDLDWVMSKDDPIHNEEEE